jgi:pyrimidine operon attenuation protein/uracil phosphoribosyltransferase
LFNQFSHLIAIGSPLSIPYSLFHLPTLYSLQLKLTNKLLAYSFLLLSFFPIFAQIKPLMQKLTLLDGPKFQITIQRLCHQLIENHNLFENSVILGIQPRGIFLAKRIVEELKIRLPKVRIESGNLDITFFRDDFRRKDGLLIPSSTEIDFIIEGKKVILVDDVLWTGRTIRAAMDALQSFGRPEKVELLTLVDRRFSRHLPIEADYIGIKVDTIASQKVIVSWKETDHEDKVILLSEK